MASQTITALGNAIINLVDRKTPIATASTVGMVKPDGSTINIDANGVISSNGGGSSRNIGEIVSSTIPLTDAGLHLLDGALIQGSGIYSAFVTYIAGLVSAYPDLFTTEANWQSTVTQYGVCGKFVYNSTNNTVRLPKYSDKIYTQELNTTAPVIGNGLALGVTNGTTNYGLSNFSNSGAGNGASYYTNYYGASVTSTGGTPGSQPGNHPVLGVTTDATKSGLVAQLSNITTSLDGYYYIVIATSTKTDIQVDIDEIATDLNGKADVDLSNVPTSKGILTESYKNGSSWYRVYSDGWCEQGGHYIHNNVEETVTTTFIKTFIDTNYNLQITKELGSSAGTAATYQFMSAYVASSKTTTQFQVRMTSANRLNGYDWQACGYIR